MVHGTINRADREQLTEWRDAGASHQRHPAVAELCLSPDKGGLELYVARLVRNPALSRLVSLLVVSSSGALRDGFRDSVLPTRVLDAAFPRLPLLAARRLASWLDAEGIDVMHLHWARDLPLAVLARALARRPVRIVYTRQMAITRSKRDWYHRALYRRIDLMLVITERLREEALRHLPMPAEHVQVLYHGVPPRAPPGDKECADLRAAAQVSPEGFVIGLFGRIEPAKGQHVLLDAMALLAQRGCDAYALVFGHPMQPRHLDDLRARIERLQLQQRVKYCGFHPDPQRVMGCCDCIVLTTYNETFGLVLIEAMRAGTAVIGTNAGGVPEIIDNEKTGLLVPPGDANALADAIERLVGDQALRARLAAAGKASADERFDEGRHFERLARWLHGERVT